MCTSLERATLTPNSVRQGHVFENLTHILRKLCHGPFADESTLNQGCWGGGGGGSVQLRKEGSVDSVTDYCVHSNPSL